MVVHYVGTLTNGKKFDSSRDRGEGFKFPLGGGRVIKGWDQGVAGMKVGRLAQAHDPAHLAYGAAGFPPVIPPNSTLVFEVELLEVRVTSPERMADLPEPPGPTTNRDRDGAGLVLCVFMAALESTVVATAMPTVIAEPRRHGALRVGHRWLSARVHGVGAGLGQTRRLTRTRAGLSRRASLLFLVGSIASGRRGASSSSSSSARAGARRGRDAPLG